MRRLKIHAIDEIVSGPDDVLGQALRQARSAAGLTPERLARLAGIRPVEISYLEAGRLGAFASPERARLVLLAYCDGVRIDPAAALGRLEPYAARQLLVPPVPAASRFGALRATSVVLLAGVIAWQAATLFADAGGREPAGPGGKPETNPILMPTN